MNTLPQEIERYIASLERLYNHAGNTLFQKILVNATPSIEEHSYDRWDGGQTGFLLRLRIPDALFADVLEDKASIEKTMEHDINTLITIQGEFVDGVVIEMQLVEDEDWRSKSDHLMTLKKEVSVKTVSRIWGAGCLKIFLSHKVEHKKETAELKMQLERYGLSCFVAHEDIQPSKEWQNEIEKALFSMDVLVALMTENFHDSNWTDQEVGVAVGRGVPVIPVKLGRDPYGFIGKYQAMNGSWQDLEAISQPNFLQNYKLAPAHDLCHNCYRKETFRWQRNAGS